MRDAVKTSEHPYFNLFPTANKTITDILKQYVDILPEEELQNFTMLCSAGTWQHAVRFQSNQSWLSLTEKDNC